MSAQTMQYREALNAAMAQELERDERVFVFGLDVPDHRGIFGSTIGLVDRFGPERVHGTPLSEDAMTGLALGAAMKGLRPVHVHIRVDFLLLATNQLLNMVSTQRYLSGGQHEIPLVIRAVIGRGWGQGAQHSKSLQSLYAHIPGLKVVMPTTPNDAKGLLVSAIRSNDPVIMLEHRWLYDVSGEVTCGEEGIPLGKAARVREGTDLTVVATSWMNVEAKLAAEILHKEAGVSLEIIDPRTLYPLDMDAITASVKKTGHCVVADYDWAFCGFSAEVAAQVHERCFGDLRSPVTRIGFAHVPCPTTRCLENEFYPNAADIVRAVEGKLGLDPIDLSGYDLYSWEHRFKGPF